MRLYQLFASQEIPIPMAEAWEFLSNPRNLQRITPKHMGFRILAGADKTMYPGQLIQYRVSPFPGISTRWVTEITHIKEGNYFVDEQRFGPYTLWQHKHFIRPTEGGVLMEDLIDYKLPFGILGRCLHRLLVKRKLIRIFQFRAARIKELFGCGRESLETLTLKAI